ncbi:unnamed protein product [Cuscuta campestris]|uniref:Uncharacterized protein n=1 Tax=Cuscuta campestris TaxID=132261 RepID=A0A484NKD0_9ASTE|nr:unnamed protein product [Cuscuta campestris]
MKSSHLLDLLIRDYTFQSYRHKPFKTGRINPVHLPPANFTGITVDAARFRCGSLRRYGATVAEFRVPPGPTLQRCSKRLMLIRQNLGPNWSKVYYDDYELSGYALVSPVLGLLAYNAGDNDDDDNNNNNNNNSTDDNNNPRVPFEIGITRTGHEEPITVDFTDTAVIGRPPSRGTVPLCASFGRDGEVAVAGMASRDDRRRVCVAGGTGHFGLVVEAPTMPWKGGYDHDEKKKVVSRGKMVVGGSFGVALGAFLMGLLVVAVMVKAKNKARMAEELVRKAYEEEALQVSMAGLHTAP